MTQEDTINSVGAYIEAAYPQAMYFTIKGPTGDGVFVAEKATIKTGATWRVYDGLFLSIKSEAFDGASQSSVEAESYALKALADRDYIAQFAVGVEEAKEMINNYFEAMVPRG